MVEVKLHIPDWERHSTEHYVSVRVGEVQRLSRISQHRSFKIPASAIGGRRYAKVEIYRRVGQGSICIDPKVTAGGSVEASLEFEGNTLQYYATVGRVPGEVPAAPVVPAPEQKLLEERKQGHPKLMDAKDFLERHHLEAHLSEAMQSMLRVRPPNPVLYLSECLAKNADLSRKMPRGQRDHVKDELQRLRWQIGMGGGSPDQPSLYGRSWTTAPSAALAAEGGGLALCVAQFNVLADGLCGMDEKQGGFTEAPAEALAWSYRRGLLVEELMRHGTRPDVVTMQEVDHFHDWFRPLMEGLGYEGRFLAKPNSQCRKSLDRSLEDGCALFWRHEVLALQQLEALVYGAEAGTPSNQVALIAEMRPLDGSPPFVLATTHLAAKKTREGEALRAQQVDELLSHIAAHDLPCVLGLDANAAPGRNGCADYASEAYPSILAHPLGLRSAYVEALGCEPRYTTWKRRGELEAKHTIDYIFTCGGVDVERVLLAPSERELVPERLPGWRYPSDHVALLAELRLPSRPFSGPFRNYLQRHFRHSGEEAMASIYRKFPCHPGALAARAARQEEQHPQVLPFSSYYRRHMGAMCEPEQLYSRFPAAPRFTPYYCKNFLDAPMEPMYRHFPERAVPALPPAPREPSSMLLSSFFIYYRRHCLPASPALPQLHAKFRKKPKLRPRKTPEPLVSLSFFLYYNRYMLPSSVGGSLDAAYRRFGLPPTATATRPQQAALLPSSPVAAQATLRGAAAAAAPLQAPAAAASTLPLSATASLVRTEAPPIGVLPTEAPFVGLPPAQTQGPVPATAGAVAADTLRMTGTLPVAAEAPDLAATASTGAPLLESTGAPLLELLQTQSHAATAGQQAVAPAVPGSLSMSTTLPRVPGEAPQPTATRAEVLQPAASTSATLSERAPQPPDAEDTTGEALPTESPAVQAPELVASVSAALSEPAAPPQLLDAEALAATSRTQAAATAPLSMSTTLPGALPEAPPPPAEEGSPLVELPPTPGFAATAGAHATTTTMGSLSMSASLPRAPTGAAALGATATESPLAEAAPAQALSATAGTHAAATGALSMSATLPSGAPAQAPLPAGDAPQAQPPASGAAAPVGAGTALASPAAGSAVAKPLEATLPTMPAAAPGASLQAPLAESLEVGAPLVQSPPAASAPAAAQAPSAAAPIDEAPTSAHPADAPAALGSTLPGQPLLPAEATQPSLADVRARTTTDNFDLGASVAITELVATQQTQVTERGDQDQTQVKPMALELSGRAESSLTGATELLNELLGRQEPDPLGKQELELHERERRTRQEPPQLPAVPQTPQLPTVPPTPTWAQPSQEPNEAFSPGVTALVSELLARQEKQDGRPQSSKTLVPVDGDGMSVTGLLDELQAKALPPSAMPVPEPPLKAARQELDGSSTLDRLRARFEGQPDDHLDFTFSVYGFMEGPAKPKFRFFHAPSVGSWCAPRLLR